MSITDLVYPPPRLPPAFALRLSQLAPRILSGSIGSSLPWPLSLLTSSETQETWNCHMNLLIFCLRTGDDRSARQCLERLKARFGDDNQRVMALRFLYESTVADDKDLPGILEDLERLLKEDSTSLLLRKRKVALLHSMGRIADAIHALIDLLDFSPTDVESWAELSELYFSQGMYAQAIFSLEEVVLVTPFAWNVHARMGELLYISSTSTAGTDGSARRNLIEAMRRFCRSIELCDNYLRGYYGLKLTTKRLLELPSTASSKHDVTDTMSDAAPPSVATVEALRELATSKLAEILRRSGSGEPGWTYDECELIAARELLDKDSQALTR